MTELNRINVVIPMAGKGSRFSQAGYKTPKPFIDVDGMPMIEHVIKNIYRPDMGLFLLVRDEHIKNYMAVLDHLKLRYGATLVSVDVETEGTVGSILFARRQLNSDIPLLVANSDQLVDFEVNDFVDDFFDRKLDGSILVFEHPQRDDKWSFAELNSSGLVVRVKEKEVISNLATVGIYLFASGRSFYDAAIDMICRRDMVNGEYYTCPVYNYLVADGKNIGVYNVDQSAMHGLGTPQDLDLFLSLRA